MNMMLNDLMDEYNLTPKDLAAKLTNVGESSVYEWLKGNCYPTIYNLIELADVFNCSIEYLIGRSEEIGNIKYKKAPSWDIQFRKILKIKNITIYRLTKDKIISLGNVNDWLHLKKNISLKNLIKLADYLQVDIDTLVGRI